MGSIKKKILVVYLIASTCLIGLGVYSWRGSQQLTNEIKELSKPNAKSRLYKKITTDLGKLNNFYLSHSTSESYDTITSHLVLIETIKSNVEELMAEYSPEDTSALSTLGKIPELLDSIEMEYYDIQKKKRENRNIFLDQLEEELKKSLSAYNVDPVYVIKSIKSDVMTQEYDTVYYNNQEPKRGNIFSKLFKKKQQEESFLIPKRDTVTVSLDTIASLSQPVHIELTVEQVFKTLYEQELQRLNDIQKFEKAVYAKNSRISHKIEKMIERFRRQEAQIQEAKNQELYQYSSQFNKTIVGTIVFFIVITLLFLFFIIKDIEQNNYYQVQLVKSQENALREAEAKQKFLTTMSHELRTPLTSIIGYAELLDDNKEYVKAIRSSSKHLLHVTNEILDMAKIVAGTIELKPEPVNLLNMLKDVKSNFEVLNNNENIDLIFDLPSEEIVLITDEIRLNQIIYNLLHNALKFTNKGYIKLQVKTEMIDNEKVSVYIKVADTGIGINKEDQARIFEDYNQAGTYKDKIKGSGLGLGIVKELVNRMGGTIRLESEPGKGTSFMINFTMDKGTFKENSEMKSLVIPSDAFKNRKVFVVDDDYLISKLYRSILEAYGADVLSSNDPLEAQTHLRENHHQYDLVIMDIKMPGLPGNQLLKELIEDGKRPSKVLASTANILLTDQEKDELRMFDEVILKPVHKNDFLEKIYKAFELLPVENQDRMEDRMYGGKGPKYEEGEGQHGGIVNYRKQDINLEHEIDLSELKMYAMGDEVLFKELLNDLITENDKELELCFEYYKIQDYKSLAEKIHKLASRYRQIKAISPVDAKQLEKSLMKSGNPPGREVYDLLSFWKDINDQLKNTQILI